MEVLDKCYKDFISGVKIIKMNTKFIIKKLTFWKLRISFGKKTSTHMDLIICIDISDLELLVCLVKLVFEYTTNGYLFLNARDVALVFLY